MSAALADPLTFACGMPFLDDTFASTRLLAAVSAIRRVAAERAGTADTMAGAHAEVWLDPHRVFAVRPDRPPMPAQRLTGHRTRMIADVLTELADIVPGWAPLLRLPVVFVLLSPARGAISASSRSWPQHVLLADEAFATTVELREQVVHELCHQWLYLIQELWALEVFGAGAVTLPSGTAGRTPDEVLGAAHVASALLRLYQATPTDSAARIAALTDYGQGCLRLLDDLEGELTEAGLTIARRLKEAM